MYRRQERPYTGFMVPLLLILILLSIFGLVQIRSGITTVQYRIGGLEKRISESMKQEKLFGARMASMLSLKQIEARGIGLGFPDRQRVIIVRRGGTGGPYTASLRQE